MNIINTVICGGDRRMLSAATLFSRLGKCHLWRCTSGDVQGAERTDNIREAAKDSFVILPIPSFDKNGMLNGAGHVNAEEFFRMLPCGTRILGAKIGAVTERLAKEHGHIFFDYGEREDFNLLNAVPTAEAAILLAMEHSPTTIHGSDFVVVGYGKIGKALAARLSMLGGNVFVAARSESALAACECDGHIPLALSDLLISPKKCKVCFNTVPVPIIDRPVLESWDCPLFLELASVPGGFTVNGQKYLSERFVSALSLSGRYFPVTAGEIIYKTALTIIKSKG